MPCETPCAVAKVEEKGEREFTIFIVYSNSRTLSVFLKKNSQTERLETIPSNSGVLGMCSAAAVLPINPAVEIYFHKGFTKGSV